MPIYVSLRIRGLYDPALWCKRKLHAFGRSEVLSGNVSGIFMDRLPLIRALMGFHTPGELQALKGHLEAREKEYKMTLESKDKELATLRLDSNSLRERAAAAEAQIKVEEEFRRKTDHLDHGPKKPSSSA
jgi:hypothetical protein